MEQRRDNYAFLTEGPVHRVIGTMAVPTIISMLVISLYNMADTFFVGRIHSRHRYRLLCYVPRASHQLLFR